MRIRVKDFILGLVLLCLAAVIGYSQQKSDTTDTSLGDIARGLKAQKAKQPKPVKVFTNDNIAGREEDAGIGATSPAKSSTEAPPEISKAPAQGHNEEYYRSRLSELQANLNTHKRELDVLQQKLGQNQVQYYSDPTKTLLQEYSRGDINKLTADIDAKKQQIADDEKAIDDLHDQLRHEGGDPGWLR
jgi:hypothetical protein